MTLERKVLLYLLALHLGAAILAVWSLRDHRPWLLAVEAWAVVSIVIGWKLFRGIFRPLQLIRAGIQFLRERDFTARLRKSGQPELDELTDVYNRMVDRLREERIRVQEQNHLFESLVRVSPSGVVLFTFDERIASINSAALGLLQAGADGLLQHSLAEVGTPFASALQELPEGEPQVIPLQGSRRVRCYKGRFLDRGFPRHFLLLEELTAELRQSERTAYETVIRTMSHEINNTVAATNSLLHSCLIYRDQLTPADRHDYQTALQTVIDRSEHLNQFVRSYAEVVRLPLPERRPCDVAVLLKEIGLLLRPELQQRGIAWQWEEHGEWPLLSLDKNQIERALLNILRNAVDAIGEQGTIRVTLNANPRPAVIIADTGPGITEEARRQLFTPFFSTKANGRGIGLTLVQEILRQHGCEFTLENGALGGARFTVWF